MAAAAPLLALVATVAILAAAAPDEHLVTDLPGFDVPLPSSHYSGYGRLTAFHLSSGDLLKFF
jgi:hypothetical protein